MSLGGIYDKREAPWVKVRRLSEYRESIELFLRQDIGERSVVSSDPIHISRSKVYFCSAYIEYLFY